ncbi:MAG: DUF2877 domain-containing protein [Anaerolineae bacterium]|nr:DUF2877 domain-containing protein [Anaerolineae bacterium]
MNRLLQAKQAAPAAWEWLAGTRQAHILHLFDHACNLVNERGDVLSLVSEQIGAGPFHVVVNEFVVGDSSPSDGDKSPTTNVVVFSDGVQEGGWRLDMSQAVRWEPRVDWEGLRAHTAVWQPYLPHLQTLVQRYRAALGLDTAVWQSKLSAGLHCLLSGIAGQEAALVRDGAAQLAGLGPGLTPAGDDMLVGVMYGLWATRPEAEARPLVELMVGTACPEPAEGAVPRTTTLSAAWLRAAERGEAGVLWHEFGNRLSAVGGRWEETVVRILGAGHSSGADALWGFTTTTAQF